MRRMSGLSSAEGPYIRATLTLSNARAMPSILGCGVRHPREGFLSAPNVPAWHMPKREKVP